MKITFRILKKHYHVNSFNDSKTRFELTKFYKILLQKKWLVFKTLSHTGKEYYVQA